MQERDSRSVNKSPRATTRPASYGLKIVCALVLFLSCVALANVSAKAAPDPNNILLDFSASWCGPCQQMSPIVSRLERQGFPIRKVDVDVEEALARQYNIRSMPTFVLVANGREVTRLSGMRDEKELRQLMAMLPRQSDEGSGKSNNPNGIPVTSTGSKSSDDKKSFLRIPPLFQKSPEAKLTPTEPDTVRGQTPTLEATDGFAHDPLLASTRIKVNDGARSHYGSGSIIESRPGRSVILTCGHIFRDLGNDATVDVDVYTGPNSKPVTVAGQILKFDLKSDLGLLAISTPRQLPTIRLANGNLGAKARVVSVGCGGGDHPTREEHVVTAINKYVGPDNVECTGVPQQGRSGGGLFLGPELVGVCIAADPKEKRGIYTGLKPVFELLAKAKLGHLAPSAQAAEGTLAESDTPVLGNAVGLVDDSPRRNDRNDDEIASLIEASTRASASQMSASASADYVGAEIVCIVRPKTPGAVSRVVIVNQASPRFVDDLLYESGGGRPDASTADRTQPSKRSASQAAAPASRRDMQKPVAIASNSADDDRPIETSFAQERYRRKRD